MTWRIPPLGFCAHCLLEVEQGDNEIPAHTTYKGTALCWRHLYLVAPRGLVTALRAGHVDD